MPGESADAATEDGHRRRIWIVLAVVALVLVAGAGTFLVLLSRDSSRPVTVEEAQERADESGDGAAAAPLLPEAGVYEYRGEGTETIDRPPVDEDQGPEMPGTVTHLGRDCWSFRIDYNTNHWRSWDYCPTDEGLVEDTAVVFQRLDLVVTEVDTTSTFTCDPPSVAIPAEQEPGDEWDERCTGTSSGIEGEVVSAGPYRFVGAETLAIGGEDVEALHYRRSRELSGAQSGSETLDIWFAADTGLILRNEREVRVQSDSLIGTVTYEEQGEFELVSTTPVP